jgi:hypothetical protein
MARYTETVTVRDGGPERAVRVMIDAPSLEGLDIQALAQEAWLRAGKKMTIGQVTIRVEAFGR